MQQNYEMYCLADQVFYDSPGLARRDDAEFALALAPVPAGWRRYAREDWLVCEPEGARVPAQGWKIHASAALSSAERILEAVWDYCVPRAIPFTFIATPHLVYLRNIKYANRESSGKFVTIYPADEAEFERVLCELGEILDGRPGPYILAASRR